MGGGEVSALAYESWWKWEEKRKARRKEEGESLKKARKRSGQLRLSPLIYLWGGRRGDKGIARGDASSPSTDLARPPTMLTWESGRDINGGGRVWPHRRPSSWVDDGPRGYCQRSGDGGPHSPG